MIYKSSLADWQIKRQDEAEAQYFLRVYGLKNPSKWAKKYEYKGAKKRINVKVTLFYIVVLVGVTYLVLNVKLWDGGTSNAKTEIETIKTLSISEIVATEVSMALPESTEIVPNIELITPANKEIIINTPYPTYTPYPTPIAGRNIDWSIGLKDFYDVTDWETVNIKVSWYFPPYGGINMRGDGIYMANGERWQDWTGKAIACPANWNFGTIVNVNGYNFICKDRGGEINCDNNNACWIDILYPYNPIENTYWGQIIEAKIYFSAE